MELVYEIEGFNGSRRVVVEPAAVNNMRAMRQINPDAHEAGGVLIGERRGDSFVVKEVTTPSSIDTSSRFRFIRHYFHHQLAVDKANQLTGGTSNYLGEWHTHPQDKPYPSSMDLENWKATFRNKEPHLAAVVGRDEEWWALYENNKFHHLRLITLE